MRALGYTGKMPELDQAPREQISNDILKRRAEQTQGIGAKP